MSTAMDGAEIETPSNDANHRFHVSRSSSARPRREPLGRGRRLRGDQDLAISPDGRNVYVTANYQLGVIDDVVDILTRYSKTGRLKRLPGPAGCIATARRADVSTCTEVLAMYGIDAIAVSPDGRHVSVPALV